MCQDVVVSTTYVILSFHIARWRMILKFIRTFHCRMVYVIMAGGIVEFDFAHATSSGSY